MCSLGVHIKLVLATVGILLSISSWVHCFAPGSLVSAYGSLGSHHSEITQCALNEIAIEFLAHKGAPVPAINTDPRADLTMCTSTSAVLEMCESIGLHCRDYSSAVAAVVAANAKVDKEQKADPYAHFDGENIYDSNRQLVAVKQAAIKAMTDSSDYIAGRQQVGRFLHTLQVRSWTYLKSILGFRPA
jgi:inactivated superfamily I helicase